MQPAASKAPTNEERRRLFRLVDADVPTPEELEAEREARRAKQAAEAAQAQRSIQEVHENLKAEGQHDLRLWDVLSGAKPSRISTNSTS